MGVDEGNLYLMGVERYIFTCSNYGVETSSKIEFPRLLAKSSLNL